MAFFRTKVLFAAFECTPFIKTGGLGDVAGSLPGALKCSACDVRVILPKLKQIPQEYHDQMEFQTSFLVPLGWRMQHCGVFTLKLGNIQYYFLENDYYFGRENAYGYGDDCERAAYFSKAVLESLQYIDFQPDVLHANDWHTALIPLLLREQYQGLELYERIKTVYTIHNLKYQGIGSDFLFEDLLGLGGCKNAWDQLRWGRDGINFMQGALYYSDAITTVSPSYAEEICTYVYGEGMDHILANRRERLHGILALPVGEYRADAALMEQRLQLLHGHRGVGHHGGEHVSRQHPAAAQDLYLDAQRRNDNRSQAQEDLHRVVGCRGIDGVEEPDGAVAQPC